MLTPSQNRSFVGRDSDLAAMMIAAQRPGLPAPAERQQAPKDDLQDHRASECGYLCRSMVIGGAYAVPLCNRPFAGIGERVFQ